MKMRPNRLNSIRDELSNAGDCSRRFLWGAACNVAIGDLLSGTSLGGRLAELSGRSILLATQDQLAAALALIELDGVAGRIFICPPDIRAEQLSLVVAQSGADAIVTDSESISHAVSANLLRVICGPAITPSKAEPFDQRCTEWVLLTSGTTGAPKMIVHTLATLTAPIHTTKSNGDDMVWGTFYDIRRYGGLQIFLRAVLSDASLVLSCTTESVADHLIRLGTHGVTHLSGTPSHWRRALMSPHIHRIAPRYIRLSGEIAEQAVLNVLGSFYPQAAITHAFASTEAGVAFEVNDGLEGFPVGVLGTHGEVEIRIMNHSLHIRSNRTALCYLGGEHGALANEEGFVDTGDMVEIRRDRCYFLGRRSGVINVGGLKVYPEEVEAVINRHPEIRISRVRSKRNSITGALVSADIVLKETPDPAVAAARFGDLTSEVLEMCRQSLPPYKVPVIIRCVSTLEVGAAGKLVRQYA